VIDSVHSASYPRRYWKDDAHRPAMVAESWKDAERALLVAVASGDVSALVAVSADAPAVAAFAGAAVPRVSGARKTSR